MLTFDEARERAREELEPKWQGPGLFYVAPWGHEDGSFYLLTVGAREAIEDNDPAFFDTTGLATLIAKVDGRLYQIPAMPNLDRLDAMTPCGEPEPELE